MEFLDKEGDELLVEGMVCPVSGCVNGKHVFKKYNNYIGHFDRFQKRNIFIYKNELWNLFSEIMYQNCLSLYFDLQKL